MVVEYEYLKLLLSVETANMEEIDVLGDSCSIAYFIILIFIF